MKARDIKLKNLSVTLLVAIMLSACASQPKAPPGSAEVREKLTRLEADSALASQAPVAIKEAEEAVAAAEKPQKKMQVSEHLVWVANRKVDIASAQAQSHLLEAQRKSITEAREAARLDSRTREADNAHQKTNDLQRQIAELNAKATERGLVVTLGDLLFETDKSELKEGSATNLAKLSAFLIQYPERTVTIEGHTDSIGSDDYNLGLSQRRVSAVRNFLINQGIAANRLSASGKGENFPVSSNDSAAGRQMNRRVEVIIANAAISQK